MSSVKKKCPGTPLVFYINGNGGLLERMKDTGADVIGLDWTVDMADGRRRLGSQMSVQGNVDPAYLFSPLPVLTDEIHRSVRFLPWKREACFNKISALCDCVNACQVLATPQSMPGAAPGN